jgi:hypothetical protein
VFHCDLWSGGGSGAAAQASLLAQQANTRANAIKSDTASIDSAFQPFNDDYYSNFTKAYEANQGGGNRPSKSAELRSKGLQMASACFTDRIEPMALAKVRQNGVRSLAVQCHHWCRHQVPGDHER